MKVKEIKPFTLEELIKKEYVFTISKVGGELQIECCITREGEYIKSIWGLSVSKVLDDSVKYVNEQYGMTNEG